MLILGLVYLALGTIGFQRALAPKSKWVVIGYFIVQNIIGGIIIFFGNGSTCLILLPLVSHSVFILLPGTLFVCTLVFTAEIFPFTWNKNWVDSFSQAVSILTAIIFVVIFTMINANEEHTLKEVRRLANELGEANRKLREYAMQAVQLAVTQEQNRLAREMHDSIGHYLTSVFIQIKAATAQMENEPTQARNALGNAHTQAPGCFIRYSAFSYCPSYGSNCKPIFT